MELTGSSVVVRQPKPTRQQKIRQLTLPRHKVSATPASTEGYLGPPAATRPKVTANPPLHRNVQGARQSPQRLGRHGSQARVQEVEGHDQDMQGPANDSSFPMGSSAPAGAPKEKGRWERKVRRSYGGAK